MFGGIVIFIIIVHTLHTALGHHSQSVRCPLGTDSYRQSLLSLFYYQKVNESPVTQKQCLPTEKSLVCCPLILQRGKLKPKAMIQCVCTTYSEFVAESMLVPFSSTSVPSHSMDGFP